MTWSPVEAIISRTAEAMTRDRRKKLAAVVMTAAAKTGGEVLVDGKVAQFVEGAEKEKCDDKSGQERADAHLQITEVFRVTDPGGPQEGGSAYFGGDEGSQHREPGHLPATGHITFHVFIPSTEADADKHHGSKVDQDDEQVG